MNGYNERVACLVPGGEACFRPTKSKTVAAMIPMASYAEKMRASVTFAVLATAALIVSVLPLFARFPPALFFAAVVAAIFGAVAVLSGSHGVYDVLKKTAPSAGIAWSVSGLVVGALVVLASIVPLVALVLIRVENGVRSKSEEKMRAIANGFQEISDGTSNTIIFVEADDDQAATWAKPADWEYDPRAPRRGLGNQRLGGGFLAGLADGSVKLISNEMDDTTLGYLFECNDGRRIQWEILNPKK